MYTNKLTAEVVIVVASVVEAKAILGTSIPFDVEYTSNIALVAGVWVTSLILCAVKGVIAYKIMVAGPI